jgi:uracil-DNA glycosylase
LSRVQKATISTRERNFALPGTVRKSPFMDKFVIVKKRKGDEILNQDIPKLKVTKTAETEESESKQEITISPEIKIVIPAECIMAQTVSDQNWRKLLAGEFAKPYYKSIEKQVAEKRKLGEVYPPVEEVFAAFNCCPLDKIKVVIIGQDPYFNPGQAEGLCFSVKKGIPVPPSLNRIYKVVQKNIPGFVIPKHGSLKEWAERGVLMLNATMTVDKGNANSHAKFGWQEFTTEVMKILNKERTGLIYLLWGGFAQKKGKVIDKTKHKVLEAAHPSPLGGSSWNDCTHFKQTNDILIKDGKEPMDWSISA